MRVRRDHLNTTVAWLFMVGSACFAVGSVPSYLTAVGAEVDALTFFVGSLFFTSASYGQALMAQSDLASQRSTGGEPTVPLLLRSWAPSDRNWSSAITQLIGTLYFNVTTAVAMVHNLSQEQEQQHVWRPDFIGSILFLVSSVLALAVLGRVWRSWAPRSNPWSMAWLNMTGSIFFMVSAVASYFVPSTGELVNQQWVNLGTFVGAVCFFAGAALMLRPSRTAVMPQ